MFITLKVGYSAGIYGCSNEYFNTIIIDGNSKDDIWNIPHYGMYGSEERVNSALKDKGYKEVYIPSDYGKIPARNLWKGFISEQQAIEEIKLI